ncbi:hypothetical protein ES703_94594 [subsurface metagenome]
MDELIRAVDEIIKPIEIKKGKSVKNISWVLVSLVLLLTNFNLIFRGAS